MSENWNALRYIQKLEQALREVLHKADTQFICRKDLEDWRLATAAERDLITRKEPVCFNQKAGREER